jgi:hypothetical protein
MQPNKNCFEQPEGAKRTTIILEEAERVFIDQLIKDGKELGIKSLFSKLLDIYRKLMIQDWKFPGEYYCGISRVAFVNIELLNILVQNTPKEKFYETGKKMGDILKVSMETTVGVDASKPENWNAVFIRLCVHGFGSLELKDKYLLLKNPFLNEPLIWEGILDGLFGITVETKTSISPFVFEIKSSP